MKKSSSLTADGHRLIALLLLLAGSLIVGATLPGSVRAEAAPKVSSRALTFAERVAYQYAIEEVYWRHRIWPKENASPKPSLDEVMSAAQIEKKVEDYLRNSQLPADQWQRPITSRDLQAEMDRMASHTMHPDVLRELFAALGNDPFVIAECLVRPILADHFAPEFSEGDPRSAADVALSTSLAAHLDNAYELPEISAPLDCNDDSWTATPLTNVPSARDLHTAVWTGSEMIVWGGFDMAGLVNTGGRYNPSTDTWTTTSTTNAPSGRRGHMAIWTGTEMIVWGGGNWDPINTGGRYNPTTNNWRATSTTNAPSPRLGHTLVWTGTKMIAWGGTDSNASLNSGGKYDPGTDQWEATTTNKAPSPRYSHSAVWSGSEMIVWGGLDFHDHNPDNLNTGGKYNPTSDSWQATNNMTAPDGRSRHTAVWIGKEMIVWGGFVWDTHGTLLNTGGKYKPGTDSWVDTSTTNVPTAREFHSAVWTGSEMIVWGGYDNHNFIEFNSGGRYDPSTESWTATSMTNPPTAREYHTAVWTGSKMIIWGGLSSPDDTNSGGSYCAQPSTPAVQSAVSRKTHGSAGSFDVELPLSDAPAIECRSSSATNDYTIVVTFLANVSVNGNPQASVASGIATIGSGGASNGGVVMISGNVVTIPLTSVANAQTINVTLNNVNGSTTVIIPMSILVADVNGNGAVNASDVSVTKSRIGQPVNQTNFRSDVNAGGAINAGDVSAIKSRVGTGLP